MDSHEFMMRFREANQALGNRPVTVEFRRHAPGTPIGQITITYRAGESVTARDLAKPKIIITHSYA